MYWLQYINKWNFVHLIKEKTEVLVIGPRNQGYCMETFLYLETMSFQASK